MTQYICTKPSVRTTMHGGYECDNWEELAQPTPLLPELSRADADSITLSVIGVLVTVWGWKQLKLMIR